MRPILLTAALIAGAALGAGPALGARHHRGGRAIAVKGRGHGHVPATLTRRPPLAGTAPVTTPATTPTDPVTTTPAPACPTAVGVREGEWFTQPSRTRLCAGRAVTWELDNAGMDDHDMTVLDMGRGTIVATWDVVHPGKLATKSLTLPAGTYRIFCTLSSGGQSHDELGMNAILTVG